MQHFSHAEQLPAAASAVVELICSEEYLRHRYQEPELLDFDLQILEDSAEKFAARVTRVYGPERVPKAARKMLGGRIELIQTQSWGRQGPVYRGQMKLEVRGVPGHIEGEMQLEDAGAEASTLSANGGIEVRVPLLGGQIEKMLVDRAEEGFARSMRSILSWIEKSG